MLGENLVMLTVVFGLDVGVGPRHSAQALSVSFLIRGGTEAVYSFRPPSLSLSSLLID